MGAARSGAGGTRYRGGFTLVEMLLATAIFVILGTMLVGVLAAATRIWRTGESRRDTYERAQVVADQLIRDLRQVFLEREPLPPGTPTEAAGIPLLAGSGRGATAFQARFDARGRPWVSFQRIQDGRVRQVFYVLDPREGSRDLLRGEADVRAFADVADLCRKMRDEEFLAKQAAPVAHGVLFLAFQFWTDQTASWSGTREPTRGKGRGNDVGSVNRWDSGTQEDPGFFLYDRRGGAVGPSGGVLPRMVRVILTVEPETRSPRKASLAQRLTEGDDVLLLDGRTDLAEAPDFVLVDDEWVLYQEAVGPRLSGLGRGARASKRAAHGEGALVLHGETFVVTVAIPAAPPAPAALQDG